MDVALCLEGLLPGAAYRGSLTDNSKAAYDGLEWLDERAKPTWLKVSRFQAISPRLVEVDRVAERQRLRWITPGAGQAMTYARKVEEARAVLQDDSPDPNAYPMLAASIGIDGEDVQQVATKIREMDAAWQVLGAAIEARRLRLKKEISEATDPSLINVNEGWPE